MTDNEPTTPRTSRGQQRPGLALPPGYSCLYPGDSYVTRRAMQLAHERGVEVFVRIGELGRYTRIAAYLVPSDLLAAVEAETRATEAERAAKRVAREQAKEKSQARKVGLVADMLRRLYPAIPTEEVGRAAAYLRNVGSVRDWRAGSPHAERMAVSGARRFIRDEHTEYSALLYGERTKDAEEQVENQIDAMLARWAGSTEPPSEA